MSDTPQNRALAPRAHDVENQSLLIDMKERDDVAMIDLRGNPDDKTFMKNAAAALGLDLPTAPRSSAKKRGLHVLWLSTISGLFWRLSRRAKG